MQKIILILTSFFISLSIHAQDLHVMSFNIRLNIASDSLNAWPYRKDLVASQILFHDIHVLGVQEALHDQMMDLKERLRHFKFTGGGRDDGKTKGEYSAIFFDSTRLHLLESKTFWLSLTPDTPGSKSWDAAITRIVTWARFRDTKTRKIFYVFNTHFDHIGKQARMESAKLLKQKAAKIAGNQPVIIMGDLNAKPNEDPYLIFTNKKDSFQVLDSKDLSLGGHYGPTGTFNGFGAKERDESPIDYIFVRGKWKVKKHATISQTWQGKFASDHFAVLAIVSLDK